MYELTITAEGIISKTTTTDFDHAAKVFADYLDTPTANGHLIDGMTGEVLMTMTDGHCDYIAPDIEEMMMDKIFEEDPVAGFALVLGGMLDAIGGALVVPSEDEDIITIN